MTQDRKWQPTPVFLPGESHGQRSLVGYSPRVAKSWTWLSNFTFTFTFHLPLLKAPNEKKWPHGPHWGLYLEAGNRSWACGRQAAGVGSLNFKRSMWTGSLEWLLGALGQWGFPWVSYIVLEKRVNMGGSWGIYIETLKSGVWWGRDLDAGLASMLMKGTGISSHDSKLSQDMTCEILHENQPSDILTSVWALSCRIFEWPEY